MKQLKSLAIALPLVTSMAFASDKSAEGIWSWSVAGQPGQTVCELKQDGEKVSGSYANEFGQAELKDGVIKDGQISFQIHREKDGQPFIITYSGKLSGGQITGDCKFVVNGGTIRLDWKAVRKPRPNAEP